MKGHRKSPSANASSSSSTGRGGNRSQQKKNVSSTTAPPVILAKNPNQNKQTSDPFSPTLNTSTTSSIDPRSLEINTTTTSMTSQAYQYQRRSSPTPQRLYVPTPSVSTVPSTRIRSPQKRKNSFSSSKQSAKLISGQYQFLPDISSRTTWMELTHFTVIGCIGMESVGKSTIMSMLADLNFLKRDMEVLCNKKSNHFFPAQTLESLLNNKHETNGIDIYVIPEEKLVLLDMQPILSTSILMEALSRNESQRFGSLLPECQLAIQSYQLVIFLLSICHYVLVVHDQYIDLKVFDFLHEAFALKKKIETNTNATVTLMEHCAELLFIANKIPDARREEDKVVYTLQRHQSALLNLQDVVSRKEKQMFVLPTRVSRLSLLPMRYILKRFK
jgi:hypothetical protein